MIRYVRYTYTYTYVHAYLHVFTLVSDAHSEQLPQHISHNLSRGSTEGNKGIGEDGGREEVGNKKGSTRTDSLHVDGLVL